MITISGATMIDFQIRVNSGQEFNTLDYQEPVTSSRSYEYTPDMESNDSRRDSFNRLFGAAGGRMYSLHFMTRGLTLTQISRLHFLRFTIDGIEVIGRDILKLSNVGIDEVSRMVNNVLKADALNITKTGKSNSRRTKTRENGEVKYWVTDTGKRSYKGKPDDGMAKRKDTSPKVYKRNRKAL